METPAIGFGEIEAVTLTYSQKRSIRFCALPLNSTESSTDYHPPIAWFPRHARPSWIERSSQALVNDRVMVLGGVGSEGEAYRLRDW